MTKRQSLQVIAAVIGFATALATFNMLKTCGGRPPSHYKQLGEITAVHGAVERRVPGAVNMETVPGPRPLYHQDLVVTQRAASATIALSPDGPTLRLNENTRFIAELDATRPGAFIGTLLDGTLSVLHPGRKGLFRLFREGHEIPLENAETTLVPVIPAENPQSARAADPTPAPGGTGIIISATVAAEEAQPAAKPSSAAASATPPEADSDILTNEDIMKTLRQQTGLFQRCYLGFIHRSGSGSAVQSGKVTVRFTVQPSGRVNEASVLRSDFRDTILNKCVREVVERARFKVFRGPAVPVEEFPISLQ